MNMAKEKSPSTLPGRCTELLDADGIKVTEFYMENIFIQLNVQEIFQAL
jgi:hypothetical protein